MDWREEKLKEELSKYDILFSDLCSLDKYDDCISEKVLLILLQWSCCGQNDASILLGRKKIAELPHEWLNSHLYNVVKHNFDYTDDWNYRRLLELVNVYLPEHINSFLDLNAETNNLDLLDVIYDFKK